PPDSPSALISRHRIGSSGFPVSWTVVRTRKRTPSAGTCTRTSASQPNDRSHEEVPMVSLRSLRILVLAGLAALMLASCSTPSVYLSPPRMCDATGGTYEGTTFNPPRAAPASAHPRSH